MEKLEKNRFVILAVLILIAIALRLWSFINDAAPKSDFDTNLASTIVGLFIIPMVYKIAKKATNNTEAALFAAALSIAIPLYSWRTVSQLSHTLAIGFFFLNILLFVHLKEIGDWKKIIVVPLIFAFTHVYSLLLIPVFALYILFVKLEDKKLNKNELIFAGVSSLFIFLIFLFFTASPAIFALAQEYVSKHYYSIVAETFTLNKAIALAGLIPIYLGFLGTYYGIKFNKKTALLTLSIICISFLAMAINIIPIILGVPYFTLSLTIMSGFTYSEFKNRLKISRFKKYELQIIILVFVLAILFGILQWI